MSYYASMNENELKAALLLLQCTELKRVIAVEETFIFDEELIRTMVKKNFLKSESGQHKWNSFVQMILDVAVHADACMYQEQKNGSICHFYYKGEAAVMLTKDVEDSQYVFSLVSLVPKMVGGMAAVYESMENRMPRIAEGSEEILFETSEIVDVENIQNLLAERGMLFQESDIQIRFEAFLNNEQRYAAVLIKNIEKHYSLVESNTTGIVMSDVDYFSMIQKVSEIMIRLHGCCIKMFGGE